jgi:hypothetical protein
MRKRSSLLFAFSVSAGLIAGASAGVAQDKTIKIDGRLPVWGAGVYFGAQGKHGVEMAFDEIGRSDLSSYRFAIQYESASPTPIRPVPQQAAPVRTKRESRRSRARPPQPSAATTGGK